MIAVCNGRKWRWALDSGRENHYNEAMRWPSFLTIALMPFLSRAEEPIVEVSTKFELVQVSSNPTEELIDWCKPICKGQKHTAHKDCDPSCDYPCQEKHLGVLIADYRLSLTEAVVKGLPGRFQLANPQLRKAVRDFLEDEVRNDTVTIPHEHFAKPCTQAYKKYACYDYRVLMYAHVAVRGINNGHAFNEIEDFDEPVAILTKPQKDPIETKEFLDCKCEQTTPAVPLLSENVVPKLTDYNPGIVFGMPGSWPAPYYPKNPNFDMVKFEGKNMGHLTYSGIAEGNSLFVPGGVTFVPQNKASQPETSLYDQWFHIGGAYRNWGPKVTLQTGDTIRAACLDIDKHEPTTDDVFTIAEEQDPVLQRLAKIANREFSHGPWDQARIWIYKNHASYKHITDRMIERSLHSMPLRNRAGRTCRRWVQGLPRPARTGAAFQSTDQQRCDLLVHS
jgi:hypothetical protein